MIGEARIIRLDRLENLHVNRPVPGQVAIGRQDVAGASNDNLPGYRDSIGVIRGSDEEIRLLMQKVPRGDGVSIWKISNSTCLLYTSPSPRDA